jgi:hypothetical protein
MHNTLFSITALDILLKNNKLALSSFQQVGFGLTCSGKERNQNDNATPCQAEINNFIRYIFFISRPANKDQVSLVRPVEKAFS